MLGCPPIPGVMAGLCRALGAMQSWESQAWPVTVASSRFRGRELRAKNILGCSGSCAEPDLFCCSQEQQGRARQAAGGFGKLR